MPRRIYKWMHPLQILKLVKTNSFLRHNATFLAGSLGVAALNYLFYPVLGRLLAPKDFGEVQALASLFTQAAIFLTILTYVTIHITVNITDVQKRNQTLLGIEKVSMIIGYTLLGIALLSVEHLRNFLRFEETWPFVALIVALALSIPLSFRMAFLRGKKQFFRASMTDGIGSAAKLILAPILVLLGFKSFGAIGALAISQILSLIVALTWARQAGFSGFAFGAGRLNVDLLRPYLKHATAVLLAASGVTNDAAVIGTSGVAGATELEGSSSDKNATSVSAQQEKDKKNNKDHDNRSDKGREHGKNGDNRGQHGYGGGNTTVRNNVNANQSGHDNVFTIVYNYFFS